MGVDFRLNAHVHGRLFRVPALAMPHASIYEATVKITEADAKMAEAEWKRVTHEEGSPQFSAMPSVNLRPAGAGVDIVIRYITRAGVRVETRNRLFAVIVELMQGESKEDQNLAPLSARGSLKG